MAPIIKPILAHPISYYQTHPLRYRKSDGTLGTYHGAGHVAGAVGYVGFVPVDLAMVGQDAVGPKGDRGCDAPSAPPGRRKKARR